MVEENAGGWGVCIMRSGRVFSSQWRQRGFVWVKTVSTAKTKLQSLVMGVGGLCAPVRSRYS